jgi:hypothetical protein
LKKKIFINYRRKDTGGHAHALFEKLARKFGAGNVKFDVVGLVPPGHDFEVVLKKSIADCDVMLSVVGPDWGEALKLRTNEDNAAEEQTRRASKDYVVEEIAIAMAFHREIIPVLVGGAQMPDPADLPQAIRAFALRQAVELRSNSYDAGFRTLHDAIKRSGPPRGTLIGAGLGFALGATLVGVALAYLWMSPRDFTHDFFRKDRNIYDSIRADYYGSALKSENVTVGKIVYVRYITPEFQVGIHAYLDVDRGSKDGEGWIDTKVSSANQLNLKRVDWFQWGGNATPILSGTSRDGENPNRIIVRPGSPTNFAIIKYYDDKAGGGDHFHFTLSGGDAGESSPVIENYVVVPRKHLDVFDINRYLFDLVPCDWCWGSVSISFSSVLFEPIDASTEKARPARDLLSQLASIEKCPWNESRCTENYERARRKTATIFSDGAFHSDVAVFHFATRPRRDMVLLYRFCSNSKGCR